MHVNEKKLIITGLVSSLVAHALMITFFTVFPELRGRPHKPKRPLEVTYQEIKTRAVSKRKAPSEDVELMKDLKSSGPEKVKVIDKKDNVFSSFRDRFMDVSKLEGKARIEKKERHEITPLDAGKKITLAPVMTEKITNPKYLTYNDDMRETISRNIKERAYTYVNHPDFESGEVYVTFVLASDGRLEQIKIIDEKTFANDYLRAVALNSIKESSPFPPFPKGFDYPEFTFNLLITFKD